MRRSLVGTRIRERRKAENLRQSELAKAADISPSYLNLIEHNRRSATPHVIKAIALALDLPLESLSEGAEAELVAELRETAASFEPHSPEINSIEEMIGRFPGWARTISAMSRQTTEMDTTIATLTDRFNYDPQLQGTFHEMLTTITAIRSTSGILAQEEDLDQEQSNRFQKIIHDESIRLSEAAQSLVGYFENTESTVPEGASPTEEFEQFLRANNYCFPSLENAKFPDRQILSVISLSSTLKSDEAKVLAKAWLEKYAIDAQNMPLEEFMTLARSSGYAPDVLADEFSVDLHSIFRRMCTLPNVNGEVPAFGLVIINAAGHPIFRRPLQDFSLPRFTSICALWPVFQAFSNPEQPIEETLALPNGGNFLARAVALPLDSYSFDARPTFASGMIVTSINDAYKFGLLKTGAQKTARQVGTSCRLCLKDDCVARSHPNTLNDDLIR